VLLAGEADVGVLGLAGRRVLRLDVLVDALLEVAGDLRGRPEDDPEADPERAGEAPSR
jgi:hypothetical protein